MGLWRRPREELFEILGGKDPAPGHQTPEPRRREAPEAPPVAASLGGGAASTEDEDLCESLFADIGDEPIVVVDRLPDPTGRAAGPRSVEVRVDTLAVGTVLGGVVVALSFLLGRASAVPEVGGAPPLTPMVAVDGSADLVAAASEAPTGPAGSGRGAPPSVRDLDVARGRSAYSIQALTTTDHTEAEEAVAWLVAEGYTSAFLAPTGGRFVVRIGGFSERDERALAAIHALSWKGRRLGDAYYVQNGN